MKTANKERLKNIAIADTDKLQVTLYLQKGSINKADTLIKLTGAKSRNDAIDRAINFYFGYISSELSQDFLCSVYGQQTEAMIKNMANRLARLDFKAAVELDMLVRLLCADLSLSKDDFNKMHSRAVEDVKRLNGSIDIYNAAIESNSDK